MTINKEPDKIIYFSEIQLKHLTTAVKFMDYCYIPLSHQTL